MKFVFGRNNSKKATINVTIDGGIATEYNKWSHGISHLVEHMIFQGPSLDYSSSLFRKMASLGADWNAYTSHNRIVFYVEVPEENIIEAASNLKNMLFDCTFNKDLLEKEKLVILEEKKADDDNTTSLIMDSLYSFLFEGPLSYPIIGTEKSIKSITFEEMYKFYKKCYIPSKMIVTIVGSKKVSFKRIVDIFGENDNKFTKTKSVKNKYIGPKNKTVKIDMNQARLFINYKSFTIDSKDNLILQFIRRFFSDGMDSRLFQTIRDKYGLCYSIGSTIQAYNDLGVFSIWLETSKENVKNVIKLINKEINNLINNPITQEEIIRARNKVISEIYSQLETSSGLATTLDARAFYNMPDIDSTIKIIKNIDIDDIKKVCNKLFYKDNRRIFKVLPKG